MIHLKLLVATVCRLALNCCNACSGSRHSKPGILGNASLVPDHALKSLHSYVLVNIEIFLLLNINYRLVVSYLFVWFPCGISLRSTGHTAEHWSLCGALVSLRSTGLTAEHWSPCGALVSLRSTGLTVGHWSHCGALVSLRSTGLTVEHWSLCEGLV